MGAGKVKKIIGQLVLSFQGGLGMPPAQRELQLDSQFAAAEKTANAPNKLTICNYFHLSATKQVKTGSRDRIFEDEDGQPLTL